ncbi:MAG: hypothetical protein M1816_007921 [Peltula sp. TS41687]|nr:MAG: hypothetical protein M1816_007921 [Peltula sp. TS41687]
MVLSNPVHRAGSLASRLGRRGFHSTRSRLGSQYHYPEGPRSNLPFDPLKKGFALKFWGFCLTGYGLPYAIAYWQMHKNK